ncbi:hypothetical protein [Heyndrickxia camelliae]|uniref:Uncharacterized protein n=1 Tax=Heyndrickxia camelliae TaxID=1707093 RepID=A0A2N3LPM7_9BACI|nr:hypothetical protein [Heyndrickxia camelliae]PKR86568.1 hypothetical protein CWO92_00440 [Heyndrickxia camelliae]
MRITPTINLINHYSNQNNYSKARSLIEKEWSHLKEYKNYQLLNSNAKQLLKIMQEEQSRSEQDLSQVEKNILNLINQSIREMSLPYAKRLFLKHHVLFEKPSAMQWLTSEARFICESWKKEKQ